jgi:electron transport complex protein RnfE
MNEKLRILTNGIIKENPSLRLVLGTCPTLAVTTLAINGLGMGLAATFVLICSNMAVSALRKVIPDQVRLPSYITIIASFVTILMMLIQAFLPDLNSALGVYLPLIVVNCIILGRAELFASKNTVIDSALDGLGMGLGFTLTLVVMGSIREVLGQGSLFGIQVLPESFDTMGVFSSAPGGFFVFGVLMALVVYVETKLGQKKERAVGCAGCPSAAVCGKDGKEGECP